MPAETPGRWRLRRILRAEMAGDSEMDRTRTLTNADVEAIVDAFEKRFYLSIGRRMWIIALGIVGGVLAYIKWK